MEQSPEHLCRTRLWHADHRLTFSFCGASNCLGISGLPFSGIFCYSTSLFEFGPSWVAGFSVNRLALDLDFGCYDILISRLNGS